MAKNPPRPERVSLGKLMHRVLTDDIAKLDASISFKDTVEAFERLKTVAGSDRRPLSAVARLVFRIGLDAVESAIEGGLVK